MANRATKSNSNNRFLSFLFRAYFVVMPVVLFLLLASFELDKPGLHYDEALEGGLPAVQLLNGQPVTVINGITLHIAGRDLPLMVQNHIGAIQVYAALPFILLGGSHPSTLRFMTVVTGALTILAVYLFVTQLYGPLAAFYASLWLSTFASFIFWSRQGVFVTSIAACFASCALAIGAYWWRTRRYWALVLAGVCIGLAIYSKLSALWLVNGLIAWWLLSISSTFWQHRRFYERTGIKPSENSFDWRRSINWRILMVGLGSIMLGLWPFFLYNLLSGEATLHVIQANSTRTYLGANNVDIIGNLQDRAIQVADVIQSGYHLWYLGGTFPNPVALISIVAGLLIIVLICWRDHWQNWRLMFLVPFLGLLVILQSCYTISALWPTHFAIATMLPAMIFGIAVSSSRSLLIRNDHFAGKCLRWLIVFLPVPVILMQIVTSFNYLNTVIKTGGVSFHSTAIYNFSRFLDGQPEHMVALDWGIAPQVEYLTNGRVPVEEFYGYEQLAPPDFGAELRKRFQHNEIYLTHAENQEAFQRRAAFLQAVSDAGLVAERLNLSVRMDGIPLLEAWRVRRP
jgi:4-amino-4-deoxy-L-arabinose transferase-like glycosyltransferase